MDRMASCAVACWVERYCYPCGEMSLLRKLQEKGGMRRGLRQQSS